MDKFLSPQEMILEREKKISQFLDAEVSDQTIYGWQLIIRKSDDAAISKAVYIRGLEKMVRRRSGEKNEVLLDAGTIAIKTFTEQQRFELNGNNKVYLDCGVVRCSREGRMIVGTDLRKALELTPHQSCRTSDINTIINRMDDERNIHTIGDLLCFERSEIECLKEIGPKRMAVIDEMLAHYNTKWAALKRPRKVMNGSVILELQIAVKDKDL